MLYVVARSVEQGTRAGIVSTLGISFGTLAHVAAAALGLSAVLAGSIVAFQALRYVGAVYLVYLGIQTLRGTAPTPGVSVPSARSDSRLFWQAALVNLLNPKTALFFFAFLPHFVAPARGEAGPQVAFLGGLYVAMALVNDGAYVLLAGRLARWMQESPLAKKL